MQLTHADAHKAALVRAEIDGNYRLIW